MKPDGTGYVLGLDIGANSVGWAMLKTDANPASLAPVTLDRVGVRVDETGVNIQDFESGREEGPAKVRREKRSIRRRLDRTARRLRALFKLLQKHASLPKAECESERGELPESVSGNQPAANSGHRFKKAMMRDEIIKELDKALLNRWMQRLISESADHEAIRLLAKRLPYVLRARALDEKLEPFEIGRAIYHLAQRRGFLSNRKAAKDEKGKEESGKVKSAIKGLYGELERTGARTLGEYFSKFDPEPRIEQDIAEEEETGKGKDQGEAQKRIRGRYTHRNMYRDELEKIWTAQQVFYPEILTDELKNEVYDRIFFQRPLESQKRLIGRCELEPDHKRAPMAILPAQRFRLLQKVNDTRISTPEGIQRQLSDKERTYLLDYLENKGDLEFSKAKKGEHLGQFFLESDMEHEPLGKVLKRSKKRLGEYVFNGEQTEKKFIGNRTNTDLLQFFGEQWHSFSNEDRDKIVDDLLSEMSEDDLAKLAMERWGLDKEKAREFAQIELEPDYCKLSRKALEKILPLMEQGTQYATASKEVYGEPKSSFAFDFLPPVDDESAVPELRNPVVRRMLGELRKVVNAIVREYGKPDIIRVELARDLRKNKKDRERISRQNFENRKERENAAKVVEDFTKRRAAGRDIQKYLLGKECDFTCPYTGKKIGMADLFGHNPLFDIEHIIPLGRSLDNSFMNKTLCCVEENRNVKRGRTPWEAYGETDKWDSIVQRVRLFKGSAARAKLERFQMKTLEEFEDFTTRQLNDTRYISRLATKYLKLLYGREADERQIVQVGRGGITAYLRDEWGLNRILRDGSQWRPEDPRPKRRDDHRHHAVDAVVIALTERKWLKVLSEAAVRARQEGRIEFAPIPEPWPGFCNDVGRQVKDVVVSHRLSRKVNGPLHKETFYGKPKSGDEGKVHIREYLNSLKASDVEDIVDPVVRERVKLRLLELGISDPSKAFAADRNLPYMEARSGRKIPIRRVRLEVTKSTFPVGSGRHVRHVETKGNHHLAIFEVKDKKGNIKWEGELVSQWKAMQRLKSGEPVVCRDRGDESKFVFSLAPGDMIELTEEETGERKRFRVRGVSAIKTGYCRIDYVDHNDARLKAEIQKKNLETGSNNWYIKPIDPLRKAGCRKIAVSPLGEVRYAND